MKQSVGTGIRLACDMTFLSRPVLLVPVWGFSLLGYFACLHDQGGGWRILTVRTADPVTPVWLLVFSSSVACVYVLNQIADVAVDRDNPGFALLSHGGVPMRAAWPAAAIFAASSMMPVMYGRPVLALLSAAAIILGAAYSFRPSGLSGRPFADFLANAAGYGIVAFGAGWHLAGGDIATTIFLRAAAPYFLLMCAGSISSTLPDVDGDRRNGKRTTAVFLGEGRANLLALVFVTAGLAVAVARRDWAAAVCAAAAWPLYILYAFYRTRTIMEAVYKVGGAACMGVAGLLYPPLIAAGILIFYATRLYFKYRFNIAYPSLLPARRA